MNSYVISPSVVASQVVPEFVQSDAATRAAAKQREFFEIIAFPPVYFDPDAADDLGDGSRGKPYKFLTDARLTPGRRHLLKAGASPITVGAGSTWLSTTKTGTAQAPIIIGRYGEGANPKINGAGANRGIRFGSSSRYFRVRDLEIYGFNAGSDRFGVSVNTVDGAAEQNVTRGIVLERLTVRDIAGDGTTDCNGIKLYGADNEILDCTVYNTGTDNIWFHGFRTLIQGCSCWNPATDGRIAGDNIQAGAQSDGSIIRGNSMDHSNADGKQCLYFELTISVSSNVLIEDNIIIGFSAANPATNSHCPLYCGATNSIIRRNYVVGGESGITVGEGSIAYGNVVIATVGNGIQLVRNSKAYHNTVVQTGTQSTQALSCGFRCGSNTNYGNEARNNLIIGFYNSVFAVTSAIDGKTTISESHNVMATQGANNAHYRLDGNVVSPSSFDLITAYTGFATALGLDSNYRPTSNSAAVYGLLADLPGTVSVPIEHDQRLVKMPRGAYAALTV